MKKTIAVAVGLSLAAMAAIGVASMLDAREAECAKGKAAQASEKAADAPMSLSTANQLLACKRYW